MTEGRLPILTGREIVKILKKIVFVKRNKFGEARSVNGIKQFFM